MGHTVTMSKFPPDLLVNEGRYFMVMIDNSTSMKRATVGDKSLFSIQLEEIGNLVSALRRGTKRNKTSIAFATFDGILQPGWQELLDDEFVLPNASSIPESNCSPVLDIVGGMLDTLEHLYVEATQQGLQVTCGALLISDGLDGFSIDGEQIPVSVSSREEIGERFIRFTSSGFTCNVLAIGCDQGESVASFFSGLQVPPESIVRTGLDPSELRRHFGDVSQKSLGSMYH